MAEYVTASGALMLPEVTIRHMNENETRRVRMEFKTNHKLRALSPQSRITPPLSRHLS